ncbi:MAG: hypothetical protein LUC24_05325 [Bacteroidales bacterium]|nr:hypothetical protein [Bacteroidales bacterium]
MERNSYIYRVSFPEPPIEGDPRTDFFFSSMRAIYDLLTPAQVGCGEKHLSRLRVPAGHVYQSRTARVSRERLYRKVQTHPRRKAPETAAETPTKANENEL